MQRITGDFSSSNNSDQIIIKDLRVRGVLGVYDRERQQPGEIIINIVLFTDTRRAAETDDIADCVNYETAAQKVRAHVEKAAHFTVEALAEDLARLCLEEPRVKKARVRVEKPRAIDFANTVGVEIERVQMRNPAQGPA